MRKVGLPIGLLKPGGRLDPVRERAERATPVGRVNAPDRRLWAV
jgi:hypothetical protein